MCHTTKSCELRGLQSWLGIPKDRSQTCEPKCIGERDGGGGGGGAVAPPKPEKTLFFGQQALEIWASTKQSLQKRKRFSKVYKD